MIRNTWATEDAAWRRFAAARSPDDIAGGGTTVGSPRAAPSPRRGRSRGGGEARARAVAAKHRRRSRGRERRRRAAAAGRREASSRPSIGNESTSVASSLPRWSRLSVRISSGLTKARPRSPSAIPSAASTWRASAAAASSSTGRPLLFSTSMRITCAAACPSPPRGACTPRRCAGRARGERRPGCRTRRTRCPRPCSGSAARG